MPSAGGNTTHACRDTRRPFPGRSAASSSPPPPERQMGQTHWRLQPVSGCESFSCEAKTKGGVRQGKQVTKPGRVAEPTPRRSPLYTNACDMRRRQTTHTPIHPARPVAKSRWRHLSKQAIPMKRCFWSPRFAGTIYIYVHIYIYNAQHLLTKCTCVALAQHRFWHLKHCFPASPEAFGVQGLFRVGLGGA